MGGRRNANDGRPESGGGEAVAVGGGTIAGDERAGDGERENREWGGRER